MGAVEPIQGHELLAAPVAAPVVDPTTTAAPTVIPATAMAAARGRRSARSLPQRENTPRMARSPYLEVAASAARERVDNYVDHSLSSRRCQPVEAMSLGRISANTFAGVR